MKLSLISGKLSYHSYGERHIGFAGFFWTIKRSKLKAFAINASARNPLFLPTMPRYSLISGSIIPILRTIEGILESCAFTEILFPIIKSVHVYVIYVWHGGIDYFSMHANKLAITAASFGVINITLFVKNSAPVPLHQPVIIFGVNDGVLALGERDKFDRLVERLNNNMSFHVWLHKKLALSYAAYSAAFAL